VNPEKSARLELFAAIEGGSSFWTSEVSTLGAVQTLELIKSGFYRSSKGEKTLSQIHPGGAAAILDEIDDAGGSFLTPEDSEWPTQLNDLAAPPIGLVVKGKIESLTQRSIAIVGTRNPTPYGARIASDFAAGFVDREWIIVSGGAYGIDTHAHKGALIAEGVTIAVIASGIDINYPAGNERLFTEIAELGAIVSEVMPGTPAFPSRFLTRNRIIAALSVSTLVVEAAFRSGSLRTARDAAELMRPVMAIPGPINSPTSEGTHRLIGERAAEIVTSVADAVELISSLDISFR
jgi:DNA protecting protein DprA